MPQFVILRHDCPQGVHFDFLLELGDVLKTWALPEPPSPGATILGNALPDHRLAYLEYEGPVSNNRGAVARWDRGVYEIEQLTNTEWIIALKGERLNGKTTIRQIANSQNQWQFEMDQTS